MSVNRENLYKHALLDYIKRHAEAVRLRNEWDDSLRVVQEILDFAEAHPDASLSPQKIIDALQILARKVDAPVSVGETMMYNNLIRARDLLHRRYLETLSAKRQRSMVVDDDNDEWIPVKLERREAYLADEEGAIAPFVEDYVRLGNKTFNVSDILRQDRDLELYRREINDLRKRIDDLESVCDGTIAHLEPYLDNFSLDRLLVRAPQSPNDGVSTKYQPRLETCVRNFVSKLLISIDSQLQSTDGIFTKSVLSAYLKILSAAATTKPREA